MIDFLDYVLADRLLLAGVTRFDSLAPEDMYLAAYYWDQRPDAWAGITDWDYRTVEAALLRTVGSKDSSSINTFKVQGLQPRIAELAFREVCRRLQGSQEAEYLRDLNAEVVKRLPRPWRQATRPVLPGADWQDQRGREYDVKCNLFFRTKQEKEGLRELLIQPESSNEQGHFYPGFVFFASTPLDCSWCYLGMYRHVGRAQSDRVCPFLFRLPNRCRFEVPGDVPPKALTTAAYLLYDWRLSLGWHLAARKPPAKCHADDPENRMLDEVVSKCAGRYKDINLEEALWRAITEVALEGCSVWGPDHVSGFLGSIGELIYRPALPLRLPKLGEVFLLARWIDDILRPITDNWGRIRCLGCGLNGAEVPGIRLSNLRMTAEGSIDGDFSCIACGERKAGVRILTHCRGCGQYPLLIGLNEVCGNCPGGLVCHGTRANGDSCLQCKRDDCPGLMKRRQEHARRMPGPPAGPSLATTSPFERV